ncbi:hypothetical protein GCM10027447_22320 [Glycomyces halotolerans]
MGIGDKFNEMKDRAEGFADDAREKAGDAFDRAKDSPLGDRIENSPLGDEAEELLGRGRDQGGESASDIEDEGR